ncbi:PTS cellobiose transporter subunit IIA [Spiroplasma sp. ChiS]|uniref:PTS lactose/cellobiose transporter subunit IIA n=1 Tax=Spiroplasma sp. ChiS TaxID=2099885 RepID=UPI000CF8F542|nr:PTS lactose/cellobiose transporter subunit IIA [Spiroplasma sp. ChiS]PQP78981.1 PTS cellobiose transporter subunit IIA [Spiroplasma sp. ChiS]
MDKIEQLVNYSFSLITYGGNAKSLELKALAKAQTNEYGVARELINEAHQELTKVHKFHAELIQHEANGEQYPMTVLAVHPQDHFNSAIIILDLAEHLICLYERTGKES